MYSILYVDDEEVLLDLNKIYLEKDGEFTVDTISSAEDAIKKIRVHSYDAIVSDYEMPVMDGIDLLKEVRRHHGSLPFLLFTGKGREEVVIEALDNGVDFYIQKGQDMQGMIAELRHKLLRAIERRRISDELERSRQQMNAIINFLPDATFVRDIEGRVIAWNRAMEQMTGVTGNTMLGKGDLEYARALYNQKRPLLADLVLEEEPCIESHLRFFQRDGDKMSAEIHVPHFNYGKGAYLLATASPLYGPEGDISGAIESFRDITEYYAIKRDLSKSKEMTQGFADMIPVGIYEMDLDYTLTFSNRASNDMFGLGADDLSENISIVDYISPSDRPRAVQDLKGLMTGTISSGKEYLLRRKDNSTFPGILYGAKIIDPETGRVVGIRGVIIDQTERKKSAQELYESRERLSLAVKAGDTGIWEVDMRTQTVHDIHEWAGRTLGYLEDDLQVITADTCKNIVHPLDLPRINYAFFMHISGNVPLFEAEFRLADKDGNWIRVEARGKVIEWGSDHEPVRITGVISVINDRK
ncbi:MAG: PAS domain S-box protein [Methanoregula sp.]|nr:PAS domain S-box protein [Methanoregula sp.]